MKLTLPLLVGLLLGTGLIAQLAIANTSLAAEAASIQEEPPIIAAMEKIHDAERAMKKAFKGEPDFALALEAVVGMQQGAAQAKLLSPPMIDSIEEAKRPAFLKGYRMKLITMGRDLLSLEELLLDGKLEEAKAMFKQVRGHEKEGHNKYAE